MASGRYLRHIRRSRALATLCAVAAITVVLVLAASVADARGNRAAGSPERPALPRLFLSPNGSDSGSCSRAAPCGSWNTAYRLARPGDVVAVAPGAYPAQTILADPKKTSTRDVVFRRVGTGVVGVAGMDIYGAHLEIDDVTFTAWPYLRTLTSAEDLTFRRDRAGKFTIAGSRNVRILGGVYGPYENGSNEVAPANRTDSTVPTNILIDGVTIHGYHQTDGLAHVDCLHSWGVNGLTVRHSIFYDCEHFDILFDVDSIVGTPTNVVIEDNFFDCCRSGYFSIYLGAQQGEAFANYLIRNNSTNKPIGIATENRTVANLRFIGNIAPSFHGCGRTGVNADYNVWYLGSKCGSHDQVAPAGFRSVATHDFHLVADAAAVNHGDPHSYSQTDVDRQHRPLGRAPDAGADERR